MARLGLREETGVVAAYRPVSRLAVVAAVAGIISSLALASPMLWVLPLVGVGLAVAGLADVAKVGAEKAGRSLALAGLALAVGFGAQAVTSTVVSRRIQDGRARAVVEAWVDAIGAGRLADARSMAGGEALPAEEPMQDGPTADQGERLANAFLAMPTVAAIRDCGAAASRQVGGIAADANAAVWNATVRLTGCAAGKDLEIAVQVTPTMIREGVGRVERWLVTRAAVVP